MSAQASTEFDYVTVGHVTADILGEDGPRRPGGGAFYSALQAARLGLRTLIITRGRPDELGELLAPYSDELTVQVQPSAQTTTLLTLGSGASRRQRLLGWAGPVDADVRLDTSILHLAAVARETPTHWQGAAGFVGITPQGLLRRWDRDGMISLGSLEQDNLPACFDAIVISEVELAGCEWLLPPTATRARQTDGTTRTDRPLVVVTAGARPITVHSPTGSVPHPPALTLSSPQDDLGAGDVFAAAFFVALVEKWDVAAAVAYANAAAAVRLAGVGPQAVGDREAISARLSQR